MAKRKKPKKKVLEQVNQLKSTVSRLDKAREQIRESQQLQQQFQQQSQQLLTNKEITMETVESQAQQASRPAPQDQPVVKDFGVVQEHASGYVMKRDLKDEKVRLCRVYRSNVDPENKDLPITLCANDAGRRITFWPGQIVPLTEAEISVLRDSVEPIEIVIPPDSGIYQARDPEAAAKQHYPNMILTRDSISGLIKMIRRSPNYIIEFIEGGTY